jgi:hypothetical protein
MKMSFEGRQLGDIHANLAISLDEARSGSSRMINLSGGRTVTVQVPAGIRDGEKIRVRGQGDPRGPEGIIGDLILQVSVIATDYLTLEHQDEQTRLEVTEQMVSVLFSSPQLSHPDYSTRRVGYAQLEKTDAHSAASAPTEAIPNPFAHGQDSRGPQAHPDQGSLLDDQTSNRTVQQIYPPQFSPPLQESARKRLKASTAVILVTAAALLVGSGLIFFLRYYQPHQARIAATQTAQTRLNNEATGTANVEGTSSAQAHATAQTDQNIYTQATRNTPTFIDSMSDQTDRQWDELTSSANGTCGFQDGSYHAKMPTVGYFQPCFAQNTNFGDFAFQVNMTLIQGNLGGIIFRADNVNDKYYLFRISPKGMYDLFLYVGNDASQAKVLLQGNTSLMNAAGQANTITLIARGNNFYFYINQKYLDSAHDATYNSGQIGVISDSSEQITEAAFSNVKVWML